MAKQKSEYEPIGPLDLRHGPALENRDTRRALLERLKGHVSSAAWLPTNGPLGAALADLREPRAEVALVHCEALVLRPFVGDRVKP